VPRPLYSPARLYVWRWLDWCIDSCDRAREDMLVYGSHARLPRACAWRGQSAAFDALVVSRRRQIKIPKRGKIYSMNEANRWDWDKPLQEYVTALQTAQGQTGVKYSSRYIGSMVRARLHGGGVVVVGVCDVRGAGAGAGAGILVTLHGLLDARPPAWCVCPPAWCVCPPAWCVCPPAWCVCPPAWCVCPPAWCVCPPAWCVCGLVCGVLQTAQGKAGVKYSGACARRRVGLGRREWRVASVPF
jgi:hypothetical protein